MTLQEFEAQEHRESFDNVKLFVVNDSGYIEAENLIISTADTLQLYPVEMTRGNDQYVLWRADLPTQFISCPASFKLSYGHAAIGTHRVEGPFTLLTKNYLSPLLPQYKPDKDIYSVFLKPEHVFSVFCGASDGLSSSDKRSFQFTVQFIDLPSNWNKETKAVYRIKKGIFSSPKPEYRSMKKYSLFPKDPDLRIRKVDVNMKINEAYINIFDDLAVSI